MKKQKKHLQTIIKIKTFINEYNWGGINFPSEKYNFKKVEKNNATIALKILYAKNKKYILLQFQNITQNNDSKQRKTRSPKRKSLNSDDEFIFD